MKSDKSISNSKNIIADAEDYLKKERQKNRLGLFEGDTSKLLLSALLKDKSEDPFLTNYTTQILKDFFHSLNKRNMNSVSFGYGLTGFAWAMNYLMQEGYIDPDTTDLSDFDSIIRDQFNKTEINLDFMSGNLSSVIYFLDRNSFEFELEKIVDHLISLSKKNGYPQLISRYYDKNDKPVTAEYFGLAHGYAGLLIIISKINKHGIREKDCGYLIDKIYQHLLTTRVNNKNGRFPIFLCKTHTPDKAFKESFSWCHGDFGIGYALYLSGRLIGNSEYQKLGLGIIDEILEQDDKFEAQLSSPFFCHGENWDCSYVQ